MSSSNRMATVGRHPPLPVQRHHVGHREVLGRLVSKVIWRVATPPSPGLRGKGVAAVVAQRLGGRPPHPSGLSRPLTDLPFSLTKVTWASTPPRRSPSPARPRRRRPRRR
ncbi:hypothetical protein I553_3345 [Mycobacterium xenopi 4042]|uniref:Uncharacterized protein n=1 Tax=Mycobacterium xenopi 4042 TaxID=1299334 RepID=X7YX29_MYCXE|nr:hypothetical protein I553_3345 [Mycobacterium xenopi 4042]